jgi:hypothetical protein
MQAPGGPPAVRQPLAGHADRLKRAMTIRSTTVRPSHGPPPRSILEGRSRTGCGAPNRGRQAGPNRRK